MPTYNQWESIASSDPQQVELSVSSVITPHRLSLKQSVQSLRSQMRYAELGQVALVRLGYGADVRIQTEGLNSFYLIQLPQYGHATVRCGQEEVESSPSVGTILNPNAEIDMLWHANNEQLMLKVDRLLVERLAVAMGVATPESGVCFPVRLEAHRAINWQLMQRYVADCARHAGSVAQSPLLISQIEQLVATTLLDAHPPLQATTRPVRTVLPKHLRVVEDYLHAYADQAIRVEDLAQLAHVSVRSLYAGFKAYFGVSPMQYLRQIRLNRARADLVNPCDPATCSVTDVALRWGFHQGRFSAEYKKRFGESPSQTLQRVRRSH